MTERLWVAVHLRLCLVVILSKKAIQMTHLLLMFIEPTHL